MIKNKLQLLELKTPTKSFSYANIWLKNLRKCITLRWVSPTVVCHRDHPGFLKNYGKSQQMQMLSCDKLLRVQKSLNCQLRSSHSDFTRVRGHQFYELCSVQPHFNRNLYTLESTKPSKTYLSFIEA